MARLVLTFLALSLLMVGDRRRRLVPACARLARGLRCSTDSTRPSSSRRARSTAGSTSSGATSSSSAGCSAASTRATRAGSARDARPSSREAPPRSKVARPHASVESALATSSRRRRTRRSSSCSTSTATSSSRRWRSTRAATRSKETWFQSGSSGTYVQPVAVSPLTGKPTITVATPLFDRSGQRIGIVAANLNLERLDRIVLPAPGLGKTGESYLVGADGHFVHAAGHGRSRTGVSSTGIDRAIAGNAGTWPLRQLSRRACDRGLPLARRGRRRPRRRAEPARGVRARRARSRSHSAASVSLVAGLLAVGITLHLAGSPARSWRSRTPPQAVAAGDLDARGPR